MQRVVSDGAGLEHLDDALVPERLLNSLVLRTFPVHHVKDVVVAVEATEAAEATATSAEAVNGAEGDRDKQQ